MEFNGHRGVRCGSADMPSLVASLVINVHRGRGACCDGVDIFGLLVATVLIELLRRGVHRGVLEDALAHWVVGANVVARLGPGEDRVGSLGAYRAGASGRGGGLKRREA